jgi:hypothetical protein
MNTPTRTPTPAPTLLTALSPAKIWIGLATSNDAGLKLDLKAEVLINGTPVGSGEVDNVGKLTSDFKSTALSTINLALTSGPAPLSPGDKLQLRVSARPTCSSGSQVPSGTARLWYNGAAIDKGARADAGSRFNATIGGGNSDYYLRTDSTAVLFLSSAAGSSRTFIDELVDSSAPCPNRLFTAFGTWSTTP